LVGGGHKFGVEGKWTSRIGKGVVDVTQLPLVRLERPR
jgi:hypothetical protein